MNFSFESFDRAIREINDNIRFLKEYYGAEIHDNDDPDWVIDEITYIERKDMIVFTMRETEEEEYEE